MLYPQFVARYSNGNDVESDIMQPAVSENIVFGGFHNQFCFCVRNKLFGIAETEIGPGFNFGKYQQFPFFAIRSISAC